MPTGLDGHPDPIVTPERDRLLRQVTDTVLDVGPGRVLVGIDGRSGSGKSTFADEVAQWLSQARRTVVRSTTDSFHHPRTERLRRGTTSPEGYYHDSHQLAVIVDELLRPFAAGASRVRTAAFDEPTDTPVRVEVEVPDEAILIFDGLFLHRPELASLWDLTVYLDADALRDAEWLAFLRDGLPGDPTEHARELDRRLRLARWPRYREGWQLYVDTVGPRTAATLIVDNNDRRKPVIASRDVRD